MDSALHVPPSLSNVSSYFRHVHFWRDLFCYLRPTSPFFVTFPMIQRKMVFQKFASFHRREGFHPKSFPFTLMIIKPSLPFSFSPRLPITILRMSSCWFRPMLVWRNAITTAILLSISIQNSAITCSCTITAGVEGPPAM